MGLFDTFRKNADPAVVNGNGKSMENPMEEYDISQLVGRISAAQTALDAKVHAFLEKANADVRLVGNFNLNEEWRCWLEQDREASRFLFDADLTDFDDEAFDCVKKEYAEELKGLLAENDAIDKMAQELDEYKLFKTSLFNVFNNGNDLPLHLYLEQIFDRAKDCGMTIKRHSREDLDLLVSFDPLAKINRGDAFFSFDFYMRFNQNYKKECHMYAACMMDASSSDSMYSGPVDLPVHNAYAKFSKDTDTFFFKDHYSLFYQQSVKAHRKKEKEKYGIPADFYEASFVDRKKLADFSEKSYQYGNSKIFIPKSQIAFAGEKVYMKRWLYAKLKKPIEQLEANLRNKKASLDDKVKAASSQTANKPDDSRNPKESVR